MRTALGRYNDGFNVYLAGGVLFGTVWGGIIFPPYYLPYFPQPIVTIITIGPVFCQTVIITNNRPYFSQTVFYTDTGVRLFNPRALPRLHACIFFACLRCFRMRSLFFGGMHARFVTLISVPLTRLYSPHAACHPE